MDENWLWLEEDELRYMCVTLSHLVNQYEMNTVRAVNEALQYGYKQGYADAVVRISFATKERDAQSLVLH
jgi:hypothetical protein